MILCRKQGGVKLRGLASVAAMFMLNLIGYNLVRTPKLLAGTG